MKTNNQKWYAVFVTHCKYLVFETYEAAWKYAQEVYESTGNVVAVEAVH
jgi:hypothetical protein